MSIDNAYELPLSTIPALEISLHVQDLLELQKFLGERGIRTENTRIERYVKYLNKASRGDIGNPEDIFKNSKDAPCESPIDWFLYVLRETHELMWILKGLKSHIPKGVDKKLEIVVGGRDFAALDKDSTSRNTQFELRIASYFCQSGCTVDLSTETDVIARVKNISFYLECKRVSNEGQVKKRIEEAYDQLSKRAPKTKGDHIIFKCIALDVTKAAFSHNGLTFAMTPDHSRDVIQAKLVSIVDRAKKLSFFGEKKEFSNVWFQIHIPSLIKHPPASVTRFSSFNFFNISSRKENRARKKFQEIFSSVSVGDERETPPAPLTMRSSIEVPAGTTFTVDSDLMMRILNGEEVSNAEREMEIARLEINGTEHVFSVFEFLSVPPGIKNEVYSSLNIDKIKAQLEIVLHMYSMRYPYEDNDPTLKNLSRP